MNHLYNPSNKHERMNYAQNALNRHQLRNNQFNLAAFKKHPTQSTHMNRLHNRLTTHELRTQCTQYTIATNTIPSIRMNHLHNAHNTYELPTQPTQNK